MADWKKLKGALGPATRVPAQVEELCGKDDTQAEYAFGVLQSALVGDGKWFPASAPAVALLLESLPKAAHKSWVVLLVADVFGANHVRAWLSPPEDGPPKDVVAAAVAGKQALFDALAGKEAGTRAAALVALTMLPSLAAETIPLIKQRATKDKDAVVRASALLALGRFAVADAASIAILTSAAKAKEELVRGAATLALLRADPKRGVVDEAPGIEAWLAWTPADDDVPLPWFGGLNHRSQFLGAPMQALVALARHRGRTAELMDLAFKLGASDRMAWRAGQMILELSGLSRFRQNELSTNFDYVALPSELTKEERQVATALAETMLLPLGATGVPAAGECRKRWLGLAPPTALEKPVRVEIEGKKSTLPFWRAWIDLKRANIAPLQQPIPPAIDGELSGLDRWAALVECGARSYRIGHVIRSESLELELAKVPAGEELLARIARIADDVSARVHAAERQGLQYVTSLMTSGLLFLPLVRAGRPIDPRWDCLIDVGDEPQSREILQALPEARREEIIWRHRPSVVGELDGIGWVMPVIDLAASVRIVGEVCQLLAKKDVRKWFRDDGALDGYLKTLRALAAKDKKLRPAVATLK